MSTWARFFVTLAGIFMVWAATAFAQCPRSGINAPELAGTDLAGKYLSLADYQGKWVYIDFWASWCKPCMRKLPQVVDLHKQLATRSDFAVISVSLDDSRTKSDLDKVYKDYGISFPVVYEGTGFKSELADNWCVDSIPSTFLIDPTGQIYAADVSPAEAQRLIEQSEAAAPVTSTAPSSSNTYQTTSTATTTNHPAATNQSPASATTPNTVAVEPAAFSYRMQLLDHAPTFGGQGLHQVQLNLPASAVNASATTFKVIAAWVDLNGQQQSREYRLAVSADPAKPLAPHDVSITGDLCFYIDQTAQEYVLELAVPAQYQTLHVSCSRYDASSGNYYSGALSRN